MPNQVYDAWMISDLALSYENHKLSQHQLDRKSTFHNSDSDNKKFADSKNIKTINLLKSPILTIINLLAERGDISEHHREKFIVSFTKTNEKIQTILSKKVVKKVKRAPKEEQKIQTLNPINPLSEKLIPTNVYNLNFNETNDSRIFNKKNSIKHKTVRWVNKFGEPYSDENIAEHQVKSFISEHFSEFPLKNGGKQLAAHNLGESQTENNNQLSDSLDLNLIQQTLKEEIQAHVFSFDDIPIGEFSNIRREIHSAFSSIPWTFADREQHQYLNNHNNISDEEVKKNIPTSLKIRSVSHLQKKHRTGISRPGTTTHLGHKYYGIEAENELSEALQNKVIESKEVQDLLNLPEPLLREAVQEAVSLGLMSVYEAKTLLEIINRPMTGLDAGNNAGNASAGTTGVAGKEAAQADDLSCSLGGSTTPAHIALPGSKCETPKLGGTGGCSTPICNSPRDLREREPLADALGHSPRLHKVAMVNPAVGFQPIESAGSHSDSPLVLERNFNTPVSGKNQDLHGCDINDINLGQEPQSLSSQSVSQNQGGTPTALGTINENFAQVEFEKAAKKETVVQAGCRARPCTATFDEE